MTSPESRPGEAASTDRSVSGTLACPRCCPASLCHAASKFGCRLGGKELNGRAELIRKQLTAPGGHLAIFGCMSLLTFSMLGIGQPRTLAPTSGAARWLEPGVRGCGFRAVALSLRGPFASTPFVGRRCLVRLLVMEAPRTTWLSTHSQRGRGFSSPATGDRPWAAHGRTSRVPTCTRGPCNRRSLEWRRPLTVPL